MAQDVTPINVRALYEAADTNGDTPSDEDDWQPVDLCALAAQIRDGTLQRVTPTILDVEGALPLFYPRRINALFGESGGMKTFVALAAIHHCTLQGQRCLFIDYEDEPAGITQRLIELGYEDWQIALVDYRNPTTGIGLGLDHLEKHLDDGDYHLIVVDSTGEAQAAGGVKGNADDENALWFAMLKRVSRLLKHPAVLVLDHIPKDPDAPEGYAIGSQRKRAAVTGASYRIDVIREPARGRDGKLKLTVAKDKLGNRAKKTVAAEIDVLTQPDGSLTLHIHQSEQQAARDAGVPWRPTGYMERVSTWLQFHPASSVRAIADGCQGKRDILLEALNALVTEGYVAVVDGPRGAKLHTGTVGYTEAGDPKLILHPTDYGTVPHRSPTVPREQGAGVENDPGTVPPVLTDTGNGARVVDLHLRDQTASTVPHPQIHPQEPF